jgi:glycosyltransferase involved in cell wall biosynthesis
MNKHVSIIMPCYNVEKYIGEAIESLLNSTYKNYEVIAINDGSKDNTLKILQEYEKLDKRIKLINHTKNKGLIYSLNEGIKLASYNILIRFDSDDIIFPWTIEEQVKRINSGCDFVFGNAIIVDNFGNEYGELKFKYSFIKLKQLKFINPILHNTVAFKKELIDKYGGYNPKAIFFEDQELWYRFFINNVKFCHINKPLVKYRISRSSTQKRNYDDYYYLIAKYLMNHSNKKAAIKLLYKIKYKKNKAKIIGRLIIPELVYRYLSILRMKIMYKKCENIYRPRINS